MITRTTGQKEQLKILTTSSATKTFNKDDVSDYGLARNKRKRVQKKQLKKNALVELMQEKGKRQATEEKLFLLKKTRRNFSKCGVKHSVKKSNYLGPR